MLGIVGMQCHYQDGRLNVHFKVALVRHVNSARADNTAKVKSTRNNRRGPGSHGRDFKLLPASQIREMV